MKTYFYILLAIFFCIPFTIAAENLQGQEPNNEFERVDIGYGVNRGQTFIVDKIYGEE